MPPHNPTTPIDPVVSEPDTSSQLLPVVRPASETAPVPKQKRRAKPPRAAGKKKPARFDPAAFEQKADVRHVFRRVIEPAQAATGTIPIVDRLAGTPYANPMLAEAPQEADELVTIDFVLDLGETLFRYGAGAFDVETSIIAVTAAFGMKNIDVDITNQSIIFNWAPEGKVPYSRVRVVRSWSGNFRALCDVHQMVTDVISGRLTRAEAQRRLEEIRSEPKPYARWVVTLAGALFAGLFASYTGAPPLDAFLGFAATLLVLGITRQLVAWRIPEIFTLAAGGFTATAFALAAVWIGADITPSMVVAGGLMILLPSVRIVNAMQDVIHAFPITAAGRLVSTLVSFAGMTAGIMTAVIAADALGAPEVEIVQGIHHIYNPAVLALLVLATAVTAAIVEQAPWRLLLPTGAVACLGFSAYYAAESLGLGSWFSPVVGAVVIGSLARIIALRLQAPLLVVAVPAMMFMLPGLIIFRGMYQIALGSSAEMMNAGLHLLFTAMTIIVAIAAGIALGDVLMRPITSRMRQNRCRVDRRDQVDDLAANTGTIPIGGRADIED
ncbi:threonine/serine exporter family protein [Nesterenkonia populi]|uniref:threonine/serine ThrE exporter family protein n=1 Tax=Nesterenkonia populi TaxID=1591087 RepID=UPI0011BEAC75|nr:threonine/serine exporter family protein [Nesterenkonia populi]